MVTKTTTLSTAQDKLLKHLEWMTSPLAGGMFELWIIQCCLIAYFIKFNSIPFLYVKLIDCNHFYSLWHTECAFILQGILFVKMYFQGLYETKSRIAKPECSPQEKETFIYICIKRYISKPALAK